MNKLKNINFMGLLLAAVAIRSLLEVNISQALVFLGLIGYVSYQAWREDNKKMSITEELKKDVEVLKSSMSGIMIKSAAKPDQIKNQMRW